MSQTLLLLISLGSNLGNRQNQLSKGLSRLILNVGGFLGVSRIYETEPVGVFNHPPYLNCVAAFQTHLEASQILNLTQQIEQDSGRTEKGNLKPRILDIDILALGNLMISEAGLELPHPGIPFRRFVLEPLFDVCPGWVHPKTGQDLRELLQQTADQSVFKWKVTLNPNDLLHPDSQLSDQIR